MTVLHKPTRSILPLTWLLVLSFALSAAQAPAAAPVERVDQVTLADQLKDKAFEALRAGDFKATDDYLSKAADASKDPALARMAEWAKQFESQRQQFAQERNRDYEKAAGQMRQLLGKAKEVYAMEYAQKAYLLAADKDAFRREADVAKLLSDAKTMAAAYEKGAQWLKSLRLYSELSSIEPENPEWKERLKTSARRIRLLAMYTPDELRVIQEADMKEREDIEAIINPTTRPTTKPSNPEAEKRNQFNWRESLRGVRLEMLRESLANAKVNYYRAISYQKMLLGGLNGLRVVATTPALQKAFPGLANRSQAAQFLGYIDASIATLEEQKNAYRFDAVTNLLDGLKEKNEETIKLPEEVLVSEFADGAFGALDPFSSIIWPTDLKEFEKTTTGQFSGVGIQIQIDDEGNLKVVTPLEDSPAYHAGIKPDSIIARINGASAKWISLNQAVQLITGPVGTSVTLTIRAPNGEEREYTLRRETIKVSSVKGWLHRPGGGWDYMIDQDQKIGYLRLTSFAQTTRADMDRALAEMTAAGLRGVILDLRGNGGGLLTSAVEVVGRFIPEGKLIVTTRPDRPDSPNPVTISKAQGGEQINTPMVVLVNQLSASASEIVAGALKDQQRAEIIGERTFGKGSVQMLYPLGREHPADTKLKLTTSHYYLPSGKCIHREENSKEWGVEPDMVVEMTPDQYKAAQDARLAADILRDTPDNPAPPPAAAGGNGEVKKKDPLSSDAQLSAALLWMRLHLARGAQSGTTQAGA